MVLLDKNTNSWCAREMPKHRNQKKMDCTNHEKEERRRGFCEEGEHASSPFLNQLLFQIAEKLGGNLNLYIKREREELEINGRTNNQALALPYFAQATELRIFLSSNVLLIFFFFLVK